MKRLARSKTVSLNELKEFPKGIERFYELQFNRLFECKKFDKKFKTTSMWKIIEVIIAANEPLHIDMLINQLGGGRMYGKRESNNLFRL